MSKVESLITEHLETWTSAIKTKASGGRGIGKKKELYGINKLRELILELAMRGHLVQQDPTDESASDLLSAVHKERATLVKEGRLGKQQFVALDTHECPYKLPSSWRWVRFGEIALHNAGKTLDKGRNSGELREYITTSNLYWGRFDLTGIRQMSIREEELQKCTATKGDLLICEGGEAGRAAVWNEHRDICFQNHIHRARLFGGINPFYAYRFFEKLGMSGEIEKYRKGVGISNMSGKALASITFPLPPLAEQHRIVSKVDELMDLCDSLEQELDSASETHDTMVSTFLGSLTVAASSADSIAAVWERIHANFDILFTTETSIDQLKQTILDLAIRGRLVKKDPSDGIGADLLERINSEREAALESHLDIEESEIPFDLPENWVWQRMGQIYLSSFYGPRFSKDVYVEKGIPTIRTTDLTAGGKINLKNPPQVHVADKVKLEQYRVQNGDLLITRSGTIGMMAVFRGDYLAIPSAYLIRLRFPTCICVEFYFHLLRSTYGLDLLGLSVRSISVPNVNATSLSKFVVPLPPLAEQHRIVAKVNELMSLCDELKRCLRSVQYTQALLADSIVESVVN